MSSCPSLSKIKKRKLHPSLMISLYKFLTLTQLIEHTCKLTRRDREFLMNNPHLKSC